MSQSQTYLIYTHVYVKQYVYLYNFNLSKKFLKILFLSGVVFALGQLSMISPVSQATGDITGKIKGRGSSKLSICYSMMVGR